MTKRTQLFFKFLSVIIMTVTSIYVYQKCKNYNIYLKLNDKLEMSKTKTSALQHYFNVTHEIDSTYKKCIDDIKIKSVKVHTFYEDCEEEYKCYFITNNTRLIREKLTDQCQNNYRQEINSQELIKMFFAYQYNLEPEHFVYNNKSNIIKQFTYETQQAQKEFDSFIIS